MEILVPIKVNIQTYLETFDQPVFQPMSQRVPIKLVHHGLLNKLVAIAPCEDSINHRVAAVRGELMDTTNITTIK